MSICIDGTLRYRFALLPKVSAMLNSSAMTRICLFRTVSLSVLKPIAFSAKKILVIIVVKASWMVVREHAARS